MRYAYFPGCVSPIKEFGYELSSRKVLERFGVELVKVEGFSCCAPACLVESFDFVGGLALTTRNICVAEELGLDMMTLCASCFGNLSRAKSLLNEHEDLRLKVNDVLSMVNRKFTGSVRITHVVKALYEDIGVKRISKEVVKPLKGARAATFYGCHLLKPYEHIRFENPEFPTCLDELVSAIGLDSVFYKEKLGCCIGCAGFFGDTISEEISAKIMLNIFKDLERRRVDCIVTACPFCCNQFDLGQYRLMEASPKIPVLYYTDLLGLALGISPDELGISLHRVDVTPLIEKLGLG